VPGFEPRSGRELVAATKPFAHEVRAKSWWYVWSTFVILLGALTVAALAPWWPLRLLASVVGGLVMVRCFILYHDYMHGAILAKSRVAKMVMYAWGGMLLAPPSSWRRNHNLHHTHVGKLDGPPAGGFSLMTVDEWRAASRWRRIGYRVSRHPLTIATAGMTVFLLAMTVGSFVENRRRHWDSLMALLGFSACVAGLWWAGGFATALFALILPYSVAAALGAYLFYVQHNFPEMEIFTADEWTRQKSAVLSSSHLELGLWMRWFTGEIGHHQVHHLNPTIPFYRLAEAMQALPELQGAAKTTLLPPDVIRCLRLALWDTTRKRMVTYAEARGSVMG
jgi:omega-6 fatty acid desaturase (delta-12 desaturase)